MGDDAYSLKKAIISNIKHNRVSIVSDMLAKTEINLDEKEKVIETGDSAPMKLVLEDQSLRYKEIQIIEFLTRDKKIKLTIL